MVPHPSLPMPSLLVQLVTLLDQLTLAPTPSATPRRGRPYHYSDRFFVKLVVVMTACQVVSVHGVLALLEQPELAAIRAAVVSGEVELRFPSRRTCERRLTAIAARLSDVIAAMGVELLPLLDPWPTGGRAAALDSTPLAARGRVWHQRERRAGIVPDTRIDTDAHWTHSGWHGWVYGYKLHVLTTVSEHVWLPLAAEVTPANVADNVQAAPLLQTLTQRSGGAPAPTVPTALARLFVLADSAYADPALWRQCAQTHWTLVASLRTPRPHTDAGVAVRRLFHQLRRQAIECWNGQFKAIFGCRSQVPTKGLVATRRFLLGSVLLYQLTLLYRWLTGRSLRVGLAAAIHAT